MVCGDDICCGCGACVSICPKKCIQLVPNNLGVIIPEIDFKECIKCGLCEKTCPKIGENKFNSPQECYAAYLKDKEKRLNSASGGVARAMYEKFLEDPKSYVVGVCWDKEFNPIFKLTNNKEDIKLFQGSKYVQAFSDDIYLKIEEKLKSECKVLYIAMPCQIAAAKKYFEAKNIYTKNLILVDILCHGVSPAQYFKEYLENLHKKLKYKKIKNISFRSNRRFRNFHFCLDYISNKDKEIKYNRFAYEDNYFNSFLDASSLRESCYTCNFSQLERISDVTIGDFFGLSKMPSSTLFNGDVGNASLILCNTEVGLNFVKQIKKYFNIFERPIQEAYEGGASFHGPYRKSKWRNKFVKYYKKGRFVQTMNKIGGWELKKIKIVHGFIRTIKEAYMKITGMEY